MAKGLGKGLSSLIPQTPRIIHETAVPVLEVVEENNEGMSVTRIKITDLTPGKFQPRQFFDQDELQDLADSIAKNGVFQPILVRKIDAEIPYEIIAGERRWRASQIAKQVDIPVIIRELEDNQALEIAIIENVQRQDLKILEVAEGYQRLMDEFSYTQEALCKIIGKSRSAIANILRLQNLPHSIKLLVNKGDLSAGHARALVATEHADIIAQQVIKKGLNVRQTETLVKKYDTEKDAKQDVTSPKPAETEVAAQEDPELQYLQQELSKTIGYKVDITHSDKGGEVVLSYNNLEELEKLLARLHRI